MRPGFGADAAAPRVKRGSAIFRRGIGGDAGAVQPGGRCGLKKELERFKTAAGGKNKQKAGSPPGCLLSV